MQAAGGHFGVDHDRHGRLQNAHHADAEHAFRGWNDVWLHPDFAAWNIEEFLPRIRCPVLAIQGRDDEYGTLAHLEAIRKHVRTPVELLVLDHCGHSPHRDQPAAVLDALARFVQRVRAPSPVAR